jgi:hypothetical protein
MSEKTQRTRIPISQELFCDGNGYLLTSSSLGNSKQTAAEVSATLFEGNHEKCLDLIKKSICLPVVFEGDCALDENTFFVIGDLTEEEENNWIAKLSWKLNIPCGKFIFCCGWMEEDLEPAVAGEPPDENYVMYQTIEVPPDEYLVEIYAYFPSLTVQVSLDEEDAYGILRENKELADYYKKKYPGIPGTDYIIRLTPLTDEPKMPKIEEGRFEEFEFRRI